MAVVLVIILIAVFVVFSVVFAGNPSGAGTCL